MKTLRLALLLILPPLLSVRADEARFFRIAGPVASTITAFSGDGYMTWTNAPTNTTFIVQTAISLNGASNWADFVQIPTSTGVNTNRLYDPAAPAGMVLIPAGSFTMGNCMATNEGRADELPLHTVYVSAFYMDRHEVTKGLWDEVYNWATNHGYSFDYSDSGQGKANNHPAQNMTWYDAVKWCNARSEKEGRTPAYYSSGWQTNIYRSGQYPIYYTYVNWNAGYRLPTEAEWEKAARGGASGRRFPWAETNITHSMANYYSTTSYTYDTSSTQYHHPTTVPGPLYTSPVGYFAANGYGLYDMAGNVEEWCWDWFGNYSSVSQSDPLGATSGTQRMVRGGSWSSFAGPCRVAYRNDIYATVRHERFGFRSVLPTGQ